MRWEHRAACIGRDDIEWFPDTGVNVSSEAKELCRSCPVRRDCAAFAIWGGPGGEVGCYDYGIWAGISAHQRQLIRRGKLDLERVLAQS